MNNTEVTADTGLGSIYLPESFIAVNLPNFDRSTRRARFNIMMMLGLTRWSEPAPRTLRSMLTGACGHKRHRRTATVETERFTCADCGIWFERMNTDW